ncbi:hypothetical protein ALC57_14734, partial [Trachymyrmex cornetzi]
VSTTLAFTSLLVSAVQTDFIQINFSSIMLHVKISLEIYLVYFYYLSCYSHPCVNQGLLCAMGMSHPNLDIICIIERDFSLGGKITNNGGDGYAFILLLPNSTNEFIQELIKTFESHNFLAKIVTLNCNGLRIE